MASHLDIVEVGKHQFARSVGSRKAALVPEFHQTLLRVGAHLGVAFGAAELDAEADELARQTEASELLPDHESFQFGKVGKVPDAQATGRLIADITYQMGRSEIVPIEFLLIRASLFADKDSAADYRCAHEIVHRTRDPDRDVRLGRPPTRHRAKGRLL